MPSNLNTFGTTKSTIIPNNESISSIPSYLTKNKQVFNKDIEAWKFNSDASNVDSVILAIGSGHLLASNNASYVIGLYSSFVLGRTGYNNRWDLNYQDNENFLVNYFDGNTYFKRFTIDYSNGNTKIRNVDLRNGNNPKCSAYYQLAFGISPESSFEDYSQYRHNFRTSHTGISQLNSENAIDLYLWDVNSDTPDEIGSKHVVRWNAIGNEELISGFRIDGGVNFPIVTSGDKTNEQTNFAIPGKGVIYYNTSTNTYRYSQNGGLFNDFGGGINGIADCLDLPCINKVSANAFDNAIDVGSWCGTGTLTLKALFLEKSDLAKTINLTGLNPADMYGLALPTPSSELAGVTFDILYVKSHNNSFNRLIVNYVYGGGFTGDTGSNLTGNTPLNVGGHVVIAGDTILVTNRSSGKTQYNGVYKVITPGSGSNGSWQYYGQSIIQWFDNMNVYVMNATGSPSWSSGTVYQLYDTTGIIDDTTTKTFRDASSDVENIFSNNNNKYDGMLALLTRNSFYWGNDSSRMFTCNLLITENTSTLSGLYSIQGVLLTDGMQVLVNRTINPELNGPYTVASGAWARNHLLVNQIVAWAWNKFNITQGIYTNTYWAMKPVSQATYTSSTPIHFTQHDDGSLLDSAIYDTNMTSLNLKLYTNDNVVKLTIKCVPSIDPITTYSVSYKWIIWNEVVVSDTTYVILP